MELRIHYTNLLPLAGLVACREASIAPPAGSGRHPARLLAVNDKVTYHVEDYDDTWTSTILDIRGHERGKVVERGKVEVYLQTVGEENEWYVKRSR